MDAFQQQPADTPPMIGIWMRSLCSPRPQKVLLLHVRPIMASLMMVCVALWQTYKMPVLGMQKNFYKEKLQTQRSQKEGR